MPDFARLFLRNSYTAPSWKDCYARNFFGESAEIRTLSPILDHHSSFYNKAHVVTIGGFIALYSYNTKVAEINAYTGKLSIFGTYSATTLRHIKDFAYQHGFGIMNKRDIELRVGVS